MSPHVNSECEFEKYLSSSQQDNGFVFCKDLVIPYNRLQFVDEPNCVICSSKQKLKKKKKSQKNIKQHFFIFLSSKEDISFWVKAFLQQNNE